MDTVQKPSNSDRILSWYVEVKVDTLRNKEKYVAEQFSCILMYVNVD
jgi:hypothetical protein